MCHIDREKTGQRKQLWNKLSTNKQHTLSLGTNQTQSTIKNGVGPERHDVDADGDENCSRTQPVTDRVAW
jgi:hypothetical protein